MDSFRLSAHPNNVKILLGIGLSNDFIVPMGIAENVNFMDKTTASFRRMQQQNPLNGKPLFFGLFFDETFVHGKEQHFGLFSFIQVHLIHLTTNKKLVDILFN